MKKNKGKEKPCTRCGECCCNILVTPKEIAKIKQVLINDPQLTLSLVRPYDKRACFFLMRNNDGTYSCAIYNTNARPAVCVAFGTKGLKKLACPHGTVSTKLSLKEAKQLVHYSPEQIAKMSYINSVFDPFVRLTVRNNIMKERYPDKKDSDFPPLLSFSL